MFVGQKHLLGLAFAIISVGAARPASAQTKEECATAYDESQTSRAAGHLEHTQRLLQLCVSESCPAFIRVDCLAWLDAVHEAQPTISLLVQSSEGNPVTPARVLLDGEPSKALAAGLTAEVDPGAHEIEVFTPEGATVLKFSAVQGTKDQVLRLTLEPTEPNVAEGRRHGLSAGFWLSVGSATALLGTSALLGLVTASDLNDLEKSCAPGCTDREVDRIQRQFLIADLALSGGLVATGLATYLGISSTKNRRIPSAHVVPTWGGARFSLQF